jgi:hypothetical protein
MPPWRIVYGAFRGSVMVAEGAHFTDELALQILVREVYTAHSLEALKRHPPAMCALP